MKQNRIWVILFWIFVLFIILNLFTNSAKQEKLISYSDFKKLAANKMILSVTVQDKFVVAKLRNGFYVKTYLPNVTPQLLDELTSYGVNVNIATPPVSNSIVKFLIDWLPFFLIIAIWIFIFSRSPGAKGLSFGKSKNTLIEPGKIKTSFSDIAGYEEVKQEVQEIVEFLKNPLKFKQIGAKIPKGVLFVGPPGTGKTLFAKAIAGEAGVHFLSTSGSEFVEMFVGVGASRIRDLFEQAKQYQPAIIFIDEIDAVGRQRGAGLGGGHDEREQTLNQLLVEMDGFTENEDIVVIAATNRPDILDKALLRPGRFDRKVFIPLPNYKERLEILTLYSKKVKVSEEVNLEFLAAATMGMSCADLANIINEAAILAVREGKQVVEQEDLDKALEKVILGPEKKSKVYKEKEKQIVAYHEAGHAILALATEDFDKLFKVSIIPRGMAGGVTFSLPQEETNLLSRKYFLSRIITILGGRIAEELFFDDITTGASNDLEKVTDMAHSYVCRYGFSKLGNRTFGKVEEYVFLGREIGISKDFSEETAKKIDEEVSNLIQYCYDIGKNYLNTHREKLEQLANLLLEKEEVDRDEILETIGEVEKLEVKLPD